MRIMILVLTSMILFSCASQEKGSPEMTKRMLKVRGYDFSEEELWRAIRQSDTLAVRGFFEAGINPNIKNSRGETALTYAIVNSNDKTVKAIAEVADINMLDELGQAPLHLALSNQKEEIFRFLLEKGADVNLGGSKGKLRNQTVLHLAVVRGREDLVRELLERGADPNLADSEGGLTLTEACIGANVNPNIVRMLIEKGADVNLAEGNGVTALMYIAENKKAPAEVKKQIAKMLLDAGADKAKRDKKGKSALDWALESKNQEVAELLR
ncbi:MAG: ankyrin repeat domain-containing protein [Pyrinomonadaceae bacterium]|nr:ankyrin repeat domain-containing protein [Pyrinomonadaceae bacterium]MCX7639641.1 ankyrin repeat domain-containing protein [Pyrinomonadaceae bacterium]MDW8303341.1 ankyrin repeat domain-containing protein [Acidobacteriota bacterium]